MKPVGGLEVFIVVHDQGILLECEAENRFASLRLYRYLFVGDGPTDALRGRDDTVIVRDLPDNIERFPNLLAFTAWYAVARNQLCSVPLVAILEYDVTIMPEFDAKSEGALLAGGCMVGYIPYRLTYPMYLHGTPCFIDSIRSVYGLDLPEFIRDRLADGLDDQWTATSNHAMRITDLEAFVDWFMPLTKEFRHDPLGAGVHERAVSVFCMLNGLEDRCVPGVLEHTQAVSHGVPALTQDETRHRALESVVLVPSRDLYPRLLFAEQRLAEETARAEALAQALAAQLERAMKLEQAVATLEQALAAQSERSTKAQAPQSLTPEIHVVAPDRTLAEARLRPTDLRRAVALAGEDPAGCRLPHGEGCQTGSVPGELPEPKSTYVINGGIRARPASSPSIGARWAST